MEYTKEFFDRIADEEKRLKFDGFTRADAKKLGDMLYTMSLDYEKPVAIEIRMNGLSVYRFFPEGTTAENEAWLSGKAKTVDKTGMSSLRMAVKLSLEGKTLEDCRLNSVDYCACGGGFPLAVKNCGIIGTICVSGLPHLMDHKLIVDTLEMYLSL